MRRLGPELVFIAGALLGTAACAADAPSLRSGSTSLTATYYGPYQRPAHAPATYGGRDAGIDTSAARARATGGAVATATSRGAGAPAARGGGPSQLPDGTASSSQAGGFDHDQAAAYVIATYELNGISLQSTEQVRVVDLYRTVQREGSIYHTVRPVVGDLVFFHNTHDANDDGRNNDWYTHVGVVESVSRDGTVTFLSFRRGEVVRDVLNLAHPQQARDGSALINSELRERSRRDPEYTQYLAGELFAGFGSLLGNRADVVVLDQWDVGRSAHASSR